MFEFKKLAGLTVGAALTMAATSGAANAAAITFSFTSATNSSTNGSPDGNTRNWTVDGLTVVATGYSNEQNNGNDNFKKGWLGQYTGGLGVTNQYENGNNDSHTVDNGGNDGRRDFVVFEFSAPIDIASISLKSFGDADISVWLGTMAAGNNFEGTETYGNNFNNGTAALSFVNDFDCDADDTHCGSGRPWTYNITSNLTGNYLIIAAQGGTQNITDEFKIAGLTVDSGTTVPEPATLALLGAGLLGLGAVRRRKTA